MKKYLIVGLNIKIIKYFKINKIFLINLKYIILIIINLIKLIKLYHINQIIIFNNLMNKYKLLNNNRILLKIVLLYVIFVKNKDNLIVIIWNVRNVNIFLFVLNAIRKKNLKKKKNYQRSQSLDRCNWTNLTIFNYNKILINKKLN